MGNNFRRTHITFLAIVSFLFLAACNNPRESSSNTGVEKSSLPSPTDANSAAVPASNITNSNSSNNTMTQEESFWAVAADGGLAEVEMGRLASQKAENPEVKKFAQMMVADHTKANNELKSIAAKQKIELPKEIGPRHRSTIDELNRLNGGDFDREYVQAMVDAHEADVQLFEGQAEDDADQQAKAFAAKTLPVLRKHLEAIKAIQSKLP